VVIHDCECASTLCFQKNTLACYNIVVHQLSLIIFSRNVTERVSSQTMIYFYTSPNNCFCKKGKVCHTRYRSLGPELIPVYRQPAHRWLEAIQPAVGCHYFPPGLRLPFQPKSVTAHWPVPNYTAWWQRHMRVSSLPKTVTWKQTGRDSNPQPFGSRANVLCHTGHNASALALPGKVTGSALAILHLSEKMQFLCFCVLPMLVHYLAKTWKDKKLHLFTQM